MVTSVGSGIGSSVGSAIEATWGTWLTPTKWIEHDSETIEWKPKRINGKGLYNGGLVARNSQRAQTSSTVTGDLKTAFYYKGLGQYLGALMGSLGVAPVQQGATAAYLQTHALANNFGQSLSLQVGRPDLAGLIHQYNYRGLKVDTAVFECALDGYLTATFTFDGQGYDQSGAYGTPVYQTSNPIFSFNQGLFRIGAYGAEVLVEGIRKWTLTMKRPMKVDNFYLDGTGLKQQQVQNAFFDIGLDIESDYISDSAFVAQFSSDTAQSMVLDFVGPSIATGATKTITGISNAAGGMVVTATAHGFTAGQTVVISGVVFTGSPNPNGTWVIGNVTTNTFTIGLNGTGFTYTSGGTAQLTYNNQVSFAVPNLRWDAEAPKVAGPDIIMPKMKLVGLYDDSHTAATISYMSTDSAL